MNNFKQAEKYDEHAKEYPFWNQMDWAESSFSPLVSVGR